MYGKSPQAIIIPDILFLFRTHVVVLKGSKFSDKLLRHEVAHAITREINYFELQIQFPKVLVTMCKLNGNPGDQIDYLPRHIS